MKLLGRKAKSVADSDDREHERELEALNDVAAG
jgi:hypothetical protein